MKVYNNLVKPISWTDFLEDLQFLFTSITAVMEVRRIVAMARRGLIPATLLALKLRTEVVILDSKYRYIKGDLLVDDDSVYGKKLNRIKQKFPKLPIAVVYVSPSQGREVSFYSRVLNFEKEDKHRRFILYPWMFHLLPEFPPDAKKLDPFGISFDKMLVGELK